jgi:transposase
VRTVELGVTLPTPSTGTTVVFGNLLVDGQRDCPGCGGEGIYSDPVIRKLTYVPVVGRPPRLRYQDTAAPTPM